MTDVLRYDPAAALRLLPEGSVEALASRLDAARAETFADIELFESGGEVPSAKQPLDAAFINLPRQLLDELDSAGDDSQIACIERTAQMLREDVDRVVLLGIGGSYMAARALFEGLCHPWHNELSREKRNGVPRVYFEGNNVDSDAQRDLLEMLPRTASCPRELSDRWAAVVISKSGGTLETAISFRQFRQALEDYYGAGSEEVRKFIVPVTGESGKLRNITNEQNYRAHFPIPDGVGGRFSIFTAVGLLPVAVLGLDIRELLRGAADMTDRFRTAPAGDNPVLDYTAVCHAAENAGANIRVLSTWGKKLEAAGLWYDQLLSESLGKDEHGATPITVVNTRDLHSRGQQHQEGRRDKLITNVIVGSPTREPLGIPTFDSDLDDLNRFSSKSVSDVLSAAILGTNKAYADEKRPTADLILPQLTEHTLGQLFQMLMLATVVEGRLIGINPYGQPGVEAYKTNTMKILAE
jgi:glucose-6-phosphate isomerase